jgi:hypothetical protein
MKTFVALAAVAIFALAGCGGESENMSAQYPPPPPPGVDSPEQLAAAGDPAAMQAPPVQAEATAQAGAEGGQVYAQPQAGDIQVGAEADEYADTDPSALTDFKPALDPYGTWREDATYGTVWTPSSTVVGADFAPYVTAGHWAYDDDYVWVSDYEWGWAPFHYGRWVWVGGYGWSWIPGRVYSGAWVTWRYGYYDGWYAGWAPLPPTWYWHGGYAVGVGFVPAAPYVFCGAGYMFHGGGVYGHLVTGSQVPVVASHTRPYVPASPAVAGGGHVGANPTVGGPSPRSLGLSGDQVPHSPQGNRGLLHAQQFAKAQTAQSFGARPPAQTFTHPATASASGMHGLNPGPSVGAQHFGSAPSGSPRLSSPTTLGHNAPVATSPQYRGVAPTPYHAPYSGGAQPYYGGHVSAPAYSAPHASTPSYSAPSYSAPHYSAPSYSAPHYSAPSYSGGGSFHSSAPSYHSSAPSFSGGGSRPSGGGFHGGGSRGGRR